jgi:regulator of sigma E protease
MLMTAVAFLITIAVLVVIHEYGHYRAAVACNVKVLRFSVGFGRVLWRHQGAETEFVLSALPLGGYVKMLDGREGPVPPADQHRAFNTKTLWQRAFVVAAGPMANLLLAIGLYASVNWLGVEEIKAKVSAPVAASAMDKSGLQSGDEIVALALLPSTQDDQVETSVDTPAWTSIRSFTDLQWLLTQATLQGQDVRLQVLRGVTDKSTVTLRLATSSLSAADVDGDLMMRLGLTGPFANAQIGKVFEGGPAQQAGLKSGDRVLALNDQPVTDAAQLRAWIASGKTPIINLQIDRQGQRLLLPVTPATMDEGGEKRVRIMAEVGSPIERVTVQYGLTEGLSQAVTRTWDVATLSLKMLGKMLIGEASLRNLSGPLSIADYAGKSAELGITYYLGFLALVSVSLGVLNLLPLPVLDGGHLMYYLFEGLTGRPVSDLWLERLQRGGMGIMLLMMSLALYNDFARLFGLH